MTDRKPNSQTGKSSDFSLSVAGTRIDNVVAPTAIPSVGGFLGNVLRGQDEIYTTGFASGQDIHAIIAGWLSKVERWAQDNDILGLVDFENDMAAKVGPLSVRVPWSKRIKDLEEYYKHVDYVRDPEPRAIEAYAREFQSISGLLLRTQGEVVKNIPLSTNSGVPFFTKRRDFIERHLYPVEQWITTNGELHDWMEYADDSTYLTAALPGWRGQEGGPDPSDVKQRMVWMFPIALNILEGQAYQPYIQACQEHKLVPAWVSQAEVEERMTRLFDTKGDNYVIGTDFSKFDQHFNRSMANIARTAYDQVFTMNKQYDYWRWEVFPKKFSIPMVLPDIDKQFVTLAVGDHTMGSGSNGTNSDETTGQRVLQHTAAIEHDAVLNENSQCNGDDGCISYDGADVDQVIETYTSFGQEMNVDKQHVSKTDAIYLKRYYHTKYRLAGVMEGIYAGSRVLGKLKYTERDISDLSDKEYVLRELSILENANAHPLFNELMKIALDHSKLRLGLDLDGGVDSLVSWANHLPMEERTKYMGYTKANMKQYGIETWSSFMWVKSHTSR